MSTQRHIWVNVDGNPVPGLLIGWQRTTDGAWEALVTYLVGEDRAITGLVAASAVRPVEVVRPGPGFAAYGQTLARDEPGSQRST